MQSSNSPDLMYFSKFAFSDDASDFDLNLSYGTNTSFASFNFSQTPNLSKRAWPGFTVCLWVKYIWEAGSKIALLSYFSISDEVVVRVVYEEGSNELHLHGNENIRYEQKE